MCGICGFVGLEDRKVLKRMTDSMSHRGPDGQGHFSDGNVSLGHRRLSIIDLSDAGKQPMSNEDSTIWVVFNGEVYNYLKLRETLRKKGHKFHSRTDTEVIVHAYEEYGDKFVGMLSGMFAFAVWDSRKKKMIIARDQIGIKPLYYYDNHSIFAFASEIKALLEIPGIERSVDTSALYDYLTYVCTPSPRTMFSGIRKLAPGHMIIIEQGSGKKSGTSVTVRKYWDLLDVKIDFSINDAEAAKKARSLLEDSVRDMMMSDVPQGLFLSGGLDSSTIAMLMSRNSEKPINTFSIGFEEGGEYFNELPYAERVAEHFSTNHKSLLINNNDVVKFIPEMVHHQDEPVADPVCVPIYYLSREARKNKVIVLQVGEGSDEIFAGYPLYEAELKLKSLVSGPFRKMPGAFRRAIASGAGIAAEATGKHSLLMAADHLKSISEGPEFPRRGVAGFTEEEKKTLLSEEMKNATAGQDSYGLFRRIARDTESRSAQRDSEDGFLQKTRMIEFKNRLPELLLMRVDKLSMAASIETRVPFLDSRLVSYCFTVPPRTVHMDGGREPKHVLRMAVGRDLPKEVLERKKVGFNVPIAHTLMKELKGLAEQELSDPSLKPFFRKESLSGLLRKHGGMNRDNMSLRIWAVLNFALWHKKWILGEKIRV